MSTINVTFGAVAPKATVAPKVVAQYAKLSFATSTSATMDRALKFRDAKINANTTKLGVTVSLAVGQNYFLQRGSTTSATTVKASLVDAAGNKTALDFSQSSDPLSVGFSVGTSGTYQLVFEGTGAIKGQVDGLTLGAQYASQTASLSFSRAHAYGYDAALNFSDAGLGKAATDLTVNLGLQTGQSYNFANLGATGDTTATLVDSAGQRTDLNLGQAFTVAATGNYQLVFKKSTALKSTLSGASLRETAKLAATSGDANVDALVFGGTDLFWNKPNASGPNVVTYGFLTSAAGQDKNGFKQMTAAQKSAVRRAFSYYGSLINVTFKEVSGSGAADINFGTNNQRGVSAGYSYYPKNSLQPGQTSVFLANDQWTSSDSQMQAGGYGYETLLHEIGHSLGLKHPGNYNAGGGGTPGPYLDTSVDDRQHTIMSYHDDSATTGVNPSTAMPYDVAALQYIYGANRAGSTATAGAFKFAANQNTLQTLWSTNGTDRIDLSALTRSSKVDLNAGSYSSINIVGPANSSNYSGNNNVAIAAGAQINNVKLSAQNGVAETVTLNDAFAKGAFDKIDAFNATDDKIALKQSLFGALSSDAIEFSTAATQSSSRIVVNSSTGEIFYDADGSGSGAAKKIAQYAAVAGHANLSASNFSFVA